MTAVGRPDNGQDEGRKFAYNPHDCPHGSWAQDGRWWQCQLCGTSQLGDVMSGRAFASARPGAREQQREQVVGLLAGHRFDPWLMKCECGQSCGWGGNPTHPEHLADALLALLAHTDEETR